MKLKNIILSVICLLITNLNAMSLREYIAQHGMPEIKNSTLDLMTRNLTDLDGLRDIPGIEQVTHLYLFNNKIRELPEDLFNVLVNLQMLFLSNNQIRELPKDIFHGLVNLKILNLYNNQISKLPEGIFNDLVNLTHLNLDNNKLKELPDGIFHTLICLVYLNLSNNKITELPEDLFNALVNLQNLKLNNNQIKLTTEEFRNRYLTINNQLNIFEFKTPKQEEAEDIQRKLIANIKVQNIPNINANLVTLKEIKELYPNLYIVPQTDEYDNTVLHLALKLSDMNLAKKIFDIIPECMHKTNSLGHTPMNLLVQVILPGKKSNNYNMISIFYFLKYIFIKDPSLAQLLYKNDYKNINPMEDLIGSARIPLLKALVKLAVPPLFVAPFAYLTNEELTAI